MDINEQNRLKRELQNNHNELLIMTPEEYAELKPKLRAFFNLDNAKTAAGYVAPADDLKTLLNQVKELGPRGRVVEKIVQGRRYIILKGSAGLRNTLKGTRYLANNPKIVSIAIGKIGATKSVLHGAKITAVLTVPISVFKWLVDEGSTLGSLIGTVASDLVKIGISAALSTAAAIAAGTITTLAAGPLVAALFVGVATAILLDKIDEEFGLTAALIKFIDETFRSLYDQTVGAFMQKMSELERILVWQARNNIPVGRGIFY